MKNPVVGSILILSKNFFCKKYILKTTFFEKKATLDNTFLIFFNSYMLIINVFSNFMYFSKRHRIFRIKTIITNQEKLSKTKVKIV